MYRDLAQKGLRPRCGVHTDITIGVPIDSEERSIQQLIVQPDDPSDAPKNDIGVFMSKNTAPEIVNYLKNTIMQKFDANDADVSFGADDLKNLSDDDVNAIFDAMPQKGETLNQYESRVSRMLEQDKENAERAKWFNKFKSMKLKSDLNNED